jgi:O-methyltransferase
MTMTPAQNAVVDDSDMHAPPLFWLMAHKISESLFALQRIGALELLRHGSTLDNLARATRVSACALDVLLGVLLKTGMVERTEQHFRLTAETALHLPMIETERRLTDWHRDQRSLECSLSEGARMRDPMDAIADEVLVSAYAHAMANGSRELALGILRCVDLQPGSTVTDLGGADGAVALELLQRRPMIRTTTVDRRVMQAPFERRRPFSFADRMSFLAADLRSPDSLALDAIRRSDVVLLLNTVHLLEERHIEALLQHILEASGSTFVVYDLFRDSSNRLGIADLLCVDWMMIGSYFRDTEHDFVGRLARIGFRVLRTSGLPTLPGRFVVAQR